MLNEVKSSKAGKTEEKLSNAKSSSAGKVETEKVPAADVKSNPDDRSKRTLILIAGLAVVTIILLILALTPSLKLSIKTKTTPTPTVYVSPAHTTLSIAQPIASGSASSSDIAISTGENRVAAVDLEIIYNPKVLLNVDIKSGTFFNDPVILQKNINTVAGKITYILGVGLGQKAVSGKGTLATITFTKAGGATGRTGLIFDPETGVSATGQIISVLKTVSNATFSTIAPTPTAAK